MYRLGSVVQASNFLDYQLLTTIRFIYETSRRIFKHNLK
jgi:hypothetical protein